MCKQVFVQYFIDLPYVDLKGTIAVQFNVNFEDEAGW